MDATKPSSPENILWFVHNGKLSPSQGRNVVFLVIVLHFLLVVSLSLLKENFSALSLLLFALIFGIIAIFGMEEFYRWFPIFLFLAVYDILAVIQQFVTINPFMESFYYFDAYTFGLFFGNRPPSYFFYENHIAVLDVFFGIFYVIHTVFPPLMALYLRVVHVDKFDQLAWSAVIIGFFAVFFYIFVPTAAPWYTYWYGFDASQVGNINQMTATAGLWYTDQALGIDFFSRLMWELTAAKFAAFPSMHVGAPAYIYFSFKKVNLKNPSRVMLVYLVIMFFAVVYLNHHWVSDALAGLFFGWLSVKLSNRLFQYRDTDTSKDATL